MPNIVEITDLSFTGVGCSCRLDLSAAQLRNRLEPAHLAAESPKVIARAGCRIHTALPAHGAQTDHRPGCRSPDPLR